MLAARALTFSRDGVDIVAAVDLTLAAGEVVAIVGKNGAGKTTLLRLVAGLLTPTRGTLTIDGAAPTAIPRRALAKKLAFLPQELDVAFPFTARELVLLGRYAARGGLTLDDAADLAAAEAAMARADVAALAERRFDALSGGERRRVMLAQAFCQGPPLLLLDEPTASLDPAHADEVFRVVAADCASSARAALLVTHDLNLAARHAGRVVVLERGRLVADGAPLDVLAGEAATRALGVPLHVGTAPTGARFVVPA